MRETRLPRILSALLLAACCSLPAVAQTATLTFTMSVPTAREDGTALAIADIATCQLYEVSMTGVQGAKVATWAMPASGSSTGGSLANVTGTKRYAATCSDKQGLESDLSNVVLVTTSRPSKSSTLQVRVAFTTSP